MALLLPDFFQLEKSDHMNTAIIAFVLEFILLLLCSLCHGMSSHMTILIYIALQNKTNVHAVSFIIGKYSIIFHILGN